MRNAARPNPLLEGLGVLVAALFLALVFHGCGDSQGATGGKPLSLTPPPGSVSGQVRDARTGAGISGALVQLEGGTQLLQATTDFLGAYAFAAVAPGHYELRAAAGTHLVRRRGVAVLTGAAYQEDLSLEPVVDRGAVELVVADGRSGALLAGVDVLELQLRRRGLTSTTGRVLFTDLPAGTVRFQLELPGYAPRTVAIQVRAGELTTPTVPMTRIGGSIAGTITSTPPAMPLPGALVSAPGLGIETYTDTLGRYRLDDVPAGAFVDLVLTEPSHMPLFVTTGVVAGAVTTLDAVMVQAFGQLQGTVRGPGGIPLAAALVTIPEHRLSTQTDLAGFYQFPRVPADLTLSIGAMAPNQVTTSVSLVMPPNGFVIQDITMDGNAGNATGVVRSSDTSAPVVGAILSISNLFVTTFSDGLGVYRFLDIPAQVHLVQVTATGFTPRTTTITVPVAGTLAQDIVLVPLGLAPAPTTLQGVTRSAASTVPVPFAVVSIPAESRTTVSGANGAYSLAGLTTTGPVSVVVNAAGFSDLVTSVTLVPGSLLVQDLVLTPL